jgi:predicted ATPase
MQQPKLIPVRQHGLASKDNLPLQPTPLIGREEEVQAASALLRRPEVRLLTLTGTAGVGKTRLALQVATELSGDVADGVHFVPLAPIRDPALVLTTITHAFGLRELGNQPAIELLTTYLRDRHLLLVLDNFEQVIAAAPFLAQLLEVCPELKLLVTSREVLHLRAEHQFPVPPLALPDLKHLPDGKALPQYAAVDLFLQRARAVKPDFQVTPENAARIAEICARLDGLPLAIELAAARIKLLSPRALLARGDRRLQVLTGGAPDLPERQRTLRHTLAWSYELLTVEEQRLFRRLAVFVGGCELSAAESVSTALGDAMPSVLDGVASLIDKNLLQTAQEAEEPRLMMLETIREYGQEALSTSGEMATARQAHAAYYLALAEEAARGYNSPQLAEWLERLEREHDNLRATMEWSLDPAQAESLLEMAYRLGEALTEFWRVRGFYNEARAFLERVLARSEGGAASVRARTLNVAAGFAFELGEYDRAETLWQESLALYRELGDIRGIASSLEGIGEIGRRKGNNIAALISQLEECLALYKEAGDLEAIARSLFSLADSVSSQRDYRRGYTLFEESLTIYRELRNKRGIANCLMQSALFLFFGAQGDQATVHKRLEESLAIYRELGDKNGMGYCCWVAGWAAFRQGDTIRAHDLIEQCLALCREMGSRWQLCWTLAYLGRIKAHQGDFAGARTLLGESLVEAHTLDDWSRAFCLERLAVVVAAQGEYAWAARLWGAAESLRENSGSPVTPAERTDYEPAMAAALTSLGEPGLCLRLGRGTQCDFRAGAYRVRTIGHLSPGLHRTSTEGHYEASYVSCKTDGTGNGGAAPGSTGAE